MGASVGSSGGVELCGAIFVLWIEGKAWNAMKRGMKKSCLKP